jgi:hypothetical protein
MASLDIEFKSVVNKKHFVPMEDKDDEILDITVSILDPVTSKEYVFPIEKSQKIFNLKQAVLMNGRMKRFLQESQFVIQSTKKKTKSILKIESPDDLDLVESTKMYVVPIISWSDQIYNKNV